MNENETVIRILPCASFDIESVESWLTDMAGEGLYLERQGNYFGLFHFRRGEPRALPYRLVSSLESTSILQQSRINGSPPPQEALDLAAHYGWEYVAYLEGFFVYRGTTERPREMETDRTLQAAAIRKVFWWNALLVPLALAILYFKYCRIYSSPISILAAPLPVLAAFFLALAADLVDVFLKYGYYRTLIRSLDLGMPLNHRKPWKPHAKYWLTWKWINAILVILFAVLFCLPRSLFL